MVSDDIDQQQVADVHDNLHAQEVLPSLVAMVFARRSEPERPGGPPGYRYESVVPLAGNRSLVGFDMAAQEANLRARSEEHTSELQSLMRISYAVFCLKKKPATYITNLAQHT